MDLDFVSVRKNAKGELGQYPVILTELASSMIYLLLEIVFTRAAPAFHNLFMVMRCVFDINTVHKNVEKLTFQAFN